MVVTVLSINIGAVILPQVLEGIKPIKEWLIIVVK